MSGTPTGRTLAPCPTCFDRREVPDDGDMDQPCPTCRPEESAKYNVQFSSAPTPGSTTGADLGPLNYKALAEIKRLGADLAAALKREGEAREKYAEAVRERDAAISTMQEAAREARERATRLEGALDAAIDDVAARAEQVWALPSPGALGIASGLRHRRDKLIEARALAPVPTAEAAEEPHGDTGEGEPK